MMMYSLANGKDMMWSFLMNYGQQSNIPALREYVYDLIRATTTEIGRAHV